MTEKAVRKIVRIDEDKCNGCGLCVPACAEGALQIIDGKARLASEVYCDGLGACLGECPQGAITIEEKASAAFDEEKVKQHLGGKIQPHHDVKVQDKLPCGCPSSTVTECSRSTTSPTTLAPQESMLGHWPVQLRLVPAVASFLKEADLALIADCVPFAYANLHRDFLKGNAVLVACPKLDDFEAHLNKLKTILSSASVKNLTVVHMEVPCCSGLVYMAKEAIKASGHNVPFDEVTIGIKGDIL